MKFFKRVLIYITVLLLVGAFVDAYNKWREANLSPEEQLERLKKDRDSFYRGVNKAMINEKWIYLTGRSIIALGLLALNVWGYFNVFNEDLGQLLNMDEVIILSYSFLAFVIAGTPTKFVGLLRNSIVNLGKRWHVGKIDIELIEKEIQELEIIIASKKK